MKKINCILLVDDNPADNEFHTIIIKEASVCNTIEVVTSGNDAITYLHKAVDTGAVPIPNMIFVDINMPGMSGFDFLHEYGSIYWKLPPEIALVMLTTSINPVDKTNSVRAGDITDFVNKPLTVDKLRKLVEKYF